MSDPESESPRRRYRCCEHCLLDIMGVCADNGEHYEPCPEDEDCPGAWPADGGHL